MRLFDRIPKTCTICKSLIENDIDEYGKIGNGVCKSCHFELLGENEPEISILRLLEKEEQWTKNTSNDMRDYHEK